MPKVRIKTARGASILIEGSTDEVAELVRRLEGATGGVLDERDDGNRRPEKRGRPVKSSLPDLLVSLVDGGFFRKPQELSSVKIKLAEMGHVYPATTLAPALLRLVRKRQIRRIKQNSRWFYTG